METCAVCEQEKDDCEDVVTVEEDRVPLMPVRLVKVCLACREE